MFIFENFSHIVSFSLRVRDLLHTFHCNLLDKQFTYFIRFHAFTLLKIHCYRCVYLLIVPPTNQCQMRISWHCLDRVNIHFCLFSLGFHRPDAVWTSEIWNSRRRTDASSSKHDKMLRFANHAGQFLRTFLQFFVGTLELVELRLSFVRRPGHCQGFRGSEEMMILLC